MSEQVLNATTSALCGKCAKPLPANGDYVVCCNCDKCYHYSPCASISETTYRRMSRERKADWKCADCRQKSRTASTSSSAELQQLEEEEESVSRIKRFRSDEISPVQTLLPNDLRDDMKDLKKIIQDMNFRLSAENSEIRKEMSNTFAAMHHLVETLTAQVTELKERNEQQDKKIEALEIKLNNIEQKALENNIEISNIPASENEDTLHVVKNIAQQLSIQLADNDVTDVYREGKKNNIILKLRSRCKKKEIMTKAKARKSTEVNNQYFNDHLTQYNKKLLWMTKSAAKQNNWRFVWVRAGCILAKKNENSNSYLIKTEKDIEIVS